MNQTLKEFVRRLLPRGVRPYSILKGPLRGQKIVCTLHDYPGAVLGTTERALVDWLARNVAYGETWLDVGAHYGYISLALSRAVGAAGRVVAFEPVVSTAGCLSRTRSLNSLDQLDIVPLALGEGDGIERQRLSLVRGMVDRTVAGTCHESFLSTSLDWLWYRISNPDQRIHGIKIDVQGAELAALKGMSITMAKWKPKLIIEFHEGVDRTEALEILASAGYSRAPLSIEHGRMVKDEALLDNSSYVFE